MMKKTVMLKGLDCANCAAKVEKAVRKIEGVRSADINFFTAKLVIEVEEASVQELMGILEKVIKKASSDVQVLQII